MVLKACSAGKLLGALETGSGRCVLAVVGRVELLLAVLALVGEVPLRQTAVSMMNALVGEVPLRQTAYGAVSMMKKVK